MLMSPILHPPLCTYHQIQRARMTSAVDSDAKPGVLSGRVQMESHPHLSLKWEKGWGDIKPTARQPLPASTGEQKEGCRAYR